MTEHNVTWRRWQRLAPRYDRAMQWIEKRLLNGSREWIGNRAQGHVLEVAAGTGLNFPHYRHTTQLTALDFSPAMTDIARHRSMKYGKEVRFVLGNASTLPFSDARFDTVVCTLSLCEVPDNAAAIREMSRVVKPGGRLLLVDHVGSTWPPIWLVQKVIEVIAGRPFAGEHFTRRQLPHVERAGFIVDERMRNKAGIIERIAAHRPG